MMNVETVAHTIQLILAPVVMVTACGLILNSLVVRYGAIAEHMRAINRERLEMLRRISYANGCAGQHCVDIVFDRGGLVVCRHTHHHDRSAILTSRVFYHLSVYFRVRPCPNLIQLLFRILSNQHRMNLQRPCDNRRIKNGREYTN